MWFGAKTEPMYNPAKARCTTIKAAACHGGRKSEQQGQVQRHSRNNYADFRQGVLHLLPAHQIGEAAPQQAQRGQQQNRVEQKGLVPDKEAQRAATLQGLLFGKGEDRHLDVAVGAQLVGIPVMSIVLILPPTGRHACDEAGEEHDEVVVEARPENLAMSRVVSDESELGEHHSKKHGVEHLHPELVEGNQYPNTQEQGGQRSEHLDGVVKVLTVQETTFGNQSAQLQVFLSASVSGRLLHRGLK